MARAILSGTLRRLCLGQPHDASSLQQASSRREGHCGGLIDFYNLPLSGEGARSLSKQAFMMLLPFWSPPAMMGGSRRKRYHRGLTGSHLPWCSASFPCCLNLWAVQGGTPHLVASLQGAATRHRAAPLSCTCQLLSCSLNLPGRGSGWGWRQTPGYLSKSCALSKHLGHLYGQAMLLVEVPKKGLYHHSGVYACQYSF